VTIELRRVKQCIAVLILTAISTLSFAAQTSIKSVRLWHAPDYTRLVFDLSGGIQHDLQQMENPHRVVLNLKGVTDAKALKAKKITDARVKSVQAGSAADGVLRVVVDTRANYRTQAFALPPNGSYGHRLVVDLYDAELMSDESAPAAKNDVAKTAGKTQIGTPVAEAAKVEKPAAAQADVAKTATDSTAKAAPVLGVQESPHVSGRPIIVAIDAGHGGDDPGAIGKRGTREKNITLAIARKLQARMAAEPGLKPVMTRTGDYFVPLDKRRQIARDRYKADLFISIHADSFPSGRAYGASVYAISRKGATSAAAARLAESENRADLVGGVSSAGKDDLLKSVLVDLSMDGTMEHSLRVGKNILGSLGSVGRLHRRNVEQAGFVVLKTPDMPSILVETGFISTPEEESKLNNPEYQQKLASAITSGVHRFFASNPIPGSYYAGLKKNPSRASAAPQQAKPVLLSGKAPRAVRTPPVTRHVIGKGETLTSIAKKYQVSPAEIRSHNGMKSDIVQIGRTLQIPNS